MARVKEIFRPEDYPGNPSEETKKDLAEFFDHLFPGGQSVNPHSGYAILAQSPKVALGISNCADPIIYSTILNERRDLREIMIQTLNLKFKYDFSFHAHLYIAPATGISVEQQAAIPYWRTSPLFDEEQKLIIEYTEAAISDHVPAEIFARLVARYGERAAVEFTVGVAWWVFWGIILNATGAVFKADNAKPLPKDEAHETSEVKKPA